MESHEGAPEAHAGARSSLLDEANAFSVSLTEYDRVSGGLSVRGWLGSEALRRGQACVRRVVAAYAEAVGEAHYFADRRVFQADPGPASSSLLNDILWSITTSLLDGAHVGEFDVDDALRLAFGRDVMSQTFGAALGGRLPDFMSGPGGFGGFPGVPDDDRIPFATLSETDCYISLREALNGVGRAAAAFGHTAPYQGMTITRLDPATGCPPDPIRVIGTGFQAQQPKDAVVVFGSARADIVPGTWSDKEFSVQIPAGVGECCVSILQVPGAVGGGDTLAQATLDLAGVVGDCFGAAGVALSDKLAHIANHAPDSEDAVCAPDGSNRFIGGPPRISYFRTNFGTTSPQRMAPGQPLQLEWSIVNATSATIRITPRAGTPPLAQTPSLPTWFVANPVAGSTVVTAAQGLVPWAVDIELRATNRCGNVNETLEVSYDPAPGLVFVGGGGRSSFDVGAIEALGQLLLSTPAVCAGSGIGALSAVCAAADYPNPASLRAFWESSNDGGDWYGPNPALNNPGDFAAVNTAEWQGRARAEVLTMDALGRLRDFMVPYKPGGDDRQLEAIIAGLAGAAADKAVDKLAGGVSAALDEAGQSALSSVPIVAIVWAAAKFAIAQFNDALKNQTATLLATTPALFDDTGLRSLLTTATAGIQGRLQTSGRRVRIPLTSLEKGRALYGLEAGGVSEAPVGSQISANVSIGSIVQASATVPFLGAPKPLGPDGFVDGSLRDPVPIGATIEAGAGTVIVVQPHVRLMAEVSALGGAGLPHIDARTSVVRDQQSLDGAVAVFGRFARDPVTKASVGGWRVPVFVIEPTVDLVGLGASVTQSGLANIMVDYGYMRAYDSLVPWMLFPSDSQHADRDEMFSDLVQSSDTIIALRVKAWDLEHRLNALRATPFGPSDRLGGPLVAVPEQSAIADIRMAKTDIRAAVVDRLAIPARFEARVAPTIPPGTITTLPVPRPRAETWVQDWEKHNFYDLVAPAVVTPSKPNGDPWVSLSYSDVWTEPAGTRPPMIWGP